jgi:ankyrin repeat protein/pSer/pThr/pTyr-binding forkhead associated (FHA) protein
LARLRIVEAAVGTGRVVELTGAELLLGRDDACQVVVNDRSLSRRHARLAPTVGGWLVIDQESGNGTFVNGRRIYEALLGHGDEILFGTVRVVFEDPPPEPATMVLLQERGTVVLPSRPETDALPPESRPVPLPPLRVAPPPPPAPPIPRPVPPVPPPPFAARVSPSPPGPATAPDTVRPPRAGRSRSTAAAILAVVLIGVALAGIAGFLAWRGRGRPQTPAARNDSLPTTPAVDAERAPLDAGASIDAGDDERLAALLGEGADPNGTGDDGLTLLHRAAWAGRAEAARLLVSKGADPLRRDPLGLTAGERALVEGRCEPGMVLLPKDGGSPGDGGRTLLHRAAEGGCGAAVTEILARGSAADVTDTAGLTPLHVAALSGRGDVVEALLSGGASVAKATPSGRMPLHLAALAGHAAAATALLAKGADPNARDARGWTPLQFAAVGGDAATVAALLAAKADPGAAGPDGTPLDVALAAGAWDAAELLSPPVP